MTNKKAVGRGRPTLPIEEKRDQIVQFRCSSEEKSNLEQAAEKSGKRLSDWIRDLAIRASRKLK